MPEGKEIAYLSLSEIFTKEQFFKIPDYQRGYAWEKDHVTDLINDIKKLVQNSKNHFTGTIVIDKNDGKDFFEVVDGQQRLTSLVILIHEICNKNRSKYKNKIEKYVQTSEPGSERLRLEPGDEDTKVFFEKCIIENNCEMESRNFLPHKNMMIAKNEFADWLNEANNDVDKILNIIEKKLKFILFIPEHTNTIGLMFEAINNRGKQLSELEKLKNYMIYLAALNDWKTVRSNVNHSWKIILNNFSKAGVQNVDEENRFLRYCYIVYFENYNLSFKDLLKDFKSKDVDNFINFLEKASKNYKYFLQLALMSEAGYLDKNVKENIKYLRCHDSNASIMPLYFAIMDKEENDKLSLLKILEKLNFRYYILGVAKRSDAHKKELYKLAHEYFSDENFNDKELKAHLIDFIKNKSLLENIQKKLQPNEETIGDFYYWKSLKYFLARYENSLCKEKSNATYNVENILKKRKDTGKRTGDYISTEHIWATANIQYHKSHYEKRRLGNFVLMGLYKNIIAGDSSIKNKIEEMRKSCGSNFIQVDKLEELLTSAHDKIKSNYIKESDDYYIALSKAINDSREKDLVDFAIETWALDDKELKEYKKTEDYKNYLKSME